MLYCYFIFLLSLMLSCLWVSPQMVVVQIRFPQPNWAGLMGSLNSLIGLTCSDSGLALMIIYLSIIFLHFHQYIYMVTKEENTFLSVTLLVVINGFLQAMIGSMKKFLPMMMKLWAMIQWNEKIQLLRFLPHLKSNKYVVLPDTST